MSMVGNAEIMVGIAEVAKPEGSIVVSLVDGGPMGVRGTSVEGDGRVESGDIIGRGDGSLVGRLVGALVSGVVEVGDGVGCRDGRLVGVAVGFGVG
jgi:hypothetical protein